MEHFCAGTTATISVAFDPARTGDVTEINRTRAEATLGKARPVTMIAIKPNRRIPFPFQRGLSCPRLSQVVCLRAPSRAEPEAERLGRPPRVGSRQGS